MGCDIHMYVEYRLKGDDKGAWHSLGGRINPGRHYLLFGHLAGVRADVTPVVEPRGIPAEPGWYSHDDFYLYITEKKSDDRHSCTIEDAEKYKNCGSKIIEQNGKPTWVEHPDWHTPAWLSSGEYAKAISRVASNDDRHLHVYRALLAAMASLQAEGFETRVVFWFDN